MTNIDTSSWKEFKLSDLFEAESGDFDIKKEHINGFGVDVVTAGETNNGVLGKSNIDAKVFDGNTITIDMFGKCTYRPDCYKMATHARVFSLKCLFDDFDEKSGLYVTTILQKLVSGFSYSNMCSWNKIKNLSIKLPVKESEEINWEYMQERISELEQERISELEQYLIAAGLNDYELTDEDKEILTTKLTDGGALQSSTSVNGCLKEARNFKLDELFGEPTRGTRLVKEYRITGDIPLVTAGFNNQGVAEYISNEEQTTFNCGLTIDMFGNCFYRGYKFKADDNILVFDLKNIPKEAKLYIASTINKVVDGLYSYSHQYRVKSFNNTIISLPITSNGTPDWEYMEKYIKATEKVVIRDVVEWKNEMIEKTKEVVDNRSNASQDIQPSDAK